jgi:urea transport system permease protein
LRALPLVLGRWLCAALLATIAFSAAHAQSPTNPAIDSAVALIGSQSFSDVEQGIEQMVASGHERAGPILRALSEDRLLVGADKSLAIKDGDKIVAAVSGKPVDAAASSFKPVRVNNKIRRVANTALGTLTLMSPDRTQRLRAADSVFKSRDAEVLPNVEKALSAEKDPQVQQRLAQAKAAIVLDSNASESDKLAAVAVVAERGDEDARALLNGLQNQTPAVSAAVAKALSSIDQQLAIWHIVQSVYYGISLGSVLLLAAIGLAITFGVMGVINMAHGEMVMIGAYTTFVVQELIRNKAPALFDYSLAIAVPLAFLVAGAIGIAIERSIIRFLYGRPLETLLATFGLSLVLQQAVRSIFGSSNREVGNPSWMSGSFELAGLTLTNNRMWIIVFAAIVLAGLMVVLRRTMFGLQMRAVTQNRRMASSMGIRTSWVDALTFGVGSGVAGIAGVALSQIDNVSPNLGQGYIIDSFMVVVFGGVGNLWGTLVGALSLGVANKILEPVAGAVLGKIIVLVLIVLFIQRKPRGLFPLKGRAAES